MTEEDFKKNVIYENKDGLHCFNCSKGLFGVSCGTYHRAELEARHYFKQYWNDGEYDGTVLEKLKSKIVES